MTYPKNAGRVRGMCASAGLWVGAAGSEVQVANTTGGLYQSGTLVTKTAAQMNAMLIGTAGGYKIAAGTFGCSGTGTVATGLTTITHAVVGLVGRTTNGMIATLDTPATCDTYILATHAAYTQHRISGTNLKIKCYRHPCKTATNGATLAVASKYHRVSWIAFGT